MKPQLFDLGFAAADFTGRMVPRCPAPSNAPRPSINDEPSLEAGPQAEASHAGIGCRMLADREGRIEGEAASAGLPTTSTPSQEKRPAAEAEFLPASAAFSSFAKASEDWSHFTESCPVSPHVDGQDQTAPASPAQVIGAVSLSLPDHAMVLVRAIAAYEQCSNEHAVMLAIAHYGKRIGAGPLARAIFEISAEGDLADLPDVPRAEANRFRGGGP